MYIFLEYFTTQHLQDLFVFHTKHTLNFVKLSSLYFTVGLSPHVPYFIQFRCLLFIMLLCYVDYAFNFKFNYVMILYILLTIVVDLVLDDFLC